MLPPWIPLAAGRHHITNFDADSARIGAREGALQFTEAQVARMIRNLFCGWDENIA
jgi:hypothetical protein